MEAQFDDNHPSLTLGFSVQFFLVFPKGYYSALNQSPARFTPERWSLHSSTPPPAQPSLVPEDFARFAIEHVFYKAKIPFQNAPEAVFHAKVPNFQTWYLKPGTHKLDAHEQYALEKAEVKTQRRYELAACELVARKFSYHNDDWRAEVATALSALRQLEEPNVALLTNCNTGLHVHIGLGDERFTFPSIKNLLMFMTSFERCFDQLCPISRQHQPQIGLSHGHDVALDTYPLNWFAQVKTQGRPEKNLKTFLLALNHCTPQDLQAFFLLTTVNLPYLRLPDLPQSRFLQFLAKHCRVDYTRVLCVFDDPALRLDRTAEEVGHDRRTGKETVEFRQHTATLEYAEVVAWIEVCSRVVSACAADSPRTDDYIRRLIATDLDNGSLTVTELLGSIQLETRSLLHYIHQLNHDDAHAVLDERDKFGHWLAINSPLAPLVRRTMIHKLSDDLNSIKFEQGIQQKAELLHYGIKLKNILTFPPEKTSFGSFPDIETQFPGPGQEDDYNGASTYASTYASTTSQSESIATGEAPVFLDLPNEEAMLALLQRLDDDETAAQFSEIQRQVEKKSRKIEDWMGDISDAGTPWTRASDDMSVDAFFTYRAELESINMNWEG